MINSNKTILELHFRITKPNYFSECPLAKYFFLNQEEINGIKVPDANGMINHAIYHGVQHHDRFIGPQVFLDIHQILAHENIKNNSNQIFPLEELRHSPIFNKMLSIISGVKLKGHFDEGFMGFIKEFLQFLRVRIKYSLLPIIIVLALFGVLIVLSQGSAVAPFIYTIF